MISSYLTPNWPAPPHVKAFSTIRLNGFSLAPFDSFNLGLHVGDDKNHVKANREKLCSELALPNSPLWLEQVHGNKIISAPEWKNTITAVADGCYSHKANQVCVIMTADCLPILICNKAGTEVMALHGGWRSLAKNIVAEGITKFQSAPADLLVWLGPAIGPNYFEVGDEVKQTFIALDSVLESCFAMSKNQSWLMNLYQVTTFLLNKLGVTNIYGAEHCTYGEKDLFFSYRRNGQTGRMASLIFLT